MTRVSVFIAFMWTAAALFLMFIGRSLTEFLLLILVANVWLAADFLLTVWLERKD